MRGVVLAVRWSAGMHEDRKPVKWMQEPRLPKLLGRTSVTIGRRVRSQKPFDQASDAHKRHELRHVWQQAGAFLPWWLLKYLNPFSGAFRRRMEEDARRQESADSPTWRIIGTVQRGWWLW